MIKTESVRRPEQDHRYQENLYLLRDRLKDNKGVESIPLSREEAQALATLALDIVFLRRGVIGVNKIGYIF